MLGTPFSASVGFQPQGLEIAQIAQQVAGEAAQVLPGLISGLLYSHPQVRAQTYQSAMPWPQGQMLQAGVSPGWVGFSPQLSQLGLTRQQAFDPTIQSLAGGFGQQPYGDIGYVAQQVAGAAAQALPGLIAGLLSSHLQLRQQTAQWGLASPQAYGMPTLGHFSYYSPQQHAIAQMVQNAVAQQLRQQTAQFGGGFQQGFGLQSPFGFSPIQQQELIPQLVQQAVAHQLRQQTAQFGVPTLQGIPGGFPGLQPEIGQLTHQISGIVAQQIPNVVAGTVSNMTGARI